MKKTAALSVCLFLSTMANATPTTWSSCQTVIGVDNRIAYNNSLLIVLSPGITGCGVTGSSYVTFAVGVDSVSSTNINDYLATGIAALSTGAKVTVHYDPGSGSCNADIMAIGAGVGPGGTC